MNGLAETPKLTAKDVCVDWGPAGCQVFLSLCYVAASLRIFAAVYMVFGLRSAQSRPVIARLIS